MLFFALCDDNPNILSKLEKMLESIFMKNNIDAQISITSATPNEILEYSKNNTIDVFILDIDLSSKMSGLELATLIRNNNKDAYIIFTTGHLEYVMLAYKVKTFDYLVKPISYEKFEETILRLIKDMKSSPNEYLKLGKNNTVINQNDIAYIKKDGMKLVIYASNRKYETYSSFNKIQSCLPENFVRCHKSYIANINNIANVQSNSNTILFSDSNSCFIGPKYKNKFMEVFNNYGNFSNDSKRTYDTK